MEWTKDEIIGSLESELNSYKKSYSKLLKEWTLEKCAREALERENKNLLEELSRAKSQS